MNAGNRARSAPFAVPGCRLTTLLACAALTACSTVRGAPEDAAGDAHDMRDVYDVPDVYDAPTGADAGPDAEIDAAADAPVDVPRTDTGLDAGDATDAQSDAGAVPDTAPLPDAGPTFYPVREPSVLTDVAGLFTTGGQYLDPGNGVLQDSWSMLVRWQGADFVTNPVAYDLGAFTGLHVPAPATQWQRGPQPEDPAGSPGVQLYDTSAGLSISTWYVPHRYIEGGGYNDMFGYAWSAARRPEAFMLRDASGAEVGLADLVLQANLAVPTFTSSAQVSGVWTAAPPDATGMYADGQFGLFAYLEDRAHPALPPIAVVAIGWGNRLTPCAPGARAFVGFDYPTGVWFSGSAICTTDTTTVIYSAPPRAATFATPEFFRVHITPANWVALVARINAAGPSSAEPGTNCQPGLTCPPIGYSADPRDYRVQYAGVIAEVVLLEGGVPRNDSAVRQATMGANVGGVGVYRYR